MQCHLVRKPFIQLSAVLSCIVALTGCAQTQLPKHQANATKVTSNITATTNHGNVSTKAKASKTSQSVDWPSFGNDVQQQRFSSVSNLTPTNISKLHLIWNLPLGTSTGANESYPLEQHGVLYVTTMKAKVFAIDVATGKVLWTYTPTLHLLDGIPTINRGVAIGDGRVFVLTADDQLIALSQSNGKPIFDVTVANEPEGYFESMAPLFADGTVFVGSAGGDEGVRGFEAAYSATTGQRLWQTYTIPARGQGWVPAIGDHGGGAVWNIPAFDPASHHVFYGTGNPSPDFFGKSRPGPDPMTDAVVNASATTGKVTWYRQEVPHDLWDYDVASPPMLFTMDGQTFVGEAGKDGYWYEWNVSTGQAPISPVPFVKEQHTPPTASGVAEWPGSDGGANYGPSAYSPTLHAVFVAGINGSETVYASPTTHSGYRVDDGTSAISAPKGNWHGTITAIDVGTGKRIWQRTTATPPIGGVTAEAGGLVFYGQANGELTACSAATGKTVWTYQARGPIGAAPIVYRVDGHSYLSVTVGGAGSLMGLFPYDGPSEMLTFRLS